MTRIEYKHSLIRVVTMLCFALLGYLNIYVGQNAQIPNGVALGFLDYNIQSYINVLLVIYMTGCSVLGALFADIGLNTKYYLEKRLFKKLEYFVFIASILMSLAGGCCMHLLHYESEFFITVFVDVFMLTLFSFIAGSLYFRVQKKPGEKPDMLICTHCKNLFSAKRDRCPSCDAEVNENMINQVWKFDNRFLRVCFYAVLLVLFIGFAFSLIPVLKF